MRYKDFIVSWAKRFVFPSPFDCMRKMPERFDISPDTILLEGTRFRFDVPDHSPKPCVTVGKDSMIGCNFIFESNGGEIRIGERSFIGGGTNLISRSSITIGNDVCIAWGCYVYDHNSHSLSWEERRKDVFRQIADYKATGNYVLNKDWSTVKTKPVVIQDKVWIGFDSVILKGVIVGEGAIIAARSVVTKDVEPWTMVAGNPASLIRRMDGGE